MAAPPSIALTIRSTRIVTLQNLALPTLALNVVRRHATRLPGTDIATVDVSMSANEQKLPRWSPDPADAKHLHLWNIQWVRDLFVILTAVFLTWVLYELRGVFMPVLLALALAYLFNPLITWLQQRWSIPRPGTIMLLLVLLILTGAALLAWLGPVVAAQAQTLARKAPHYLQTLGARYGVGSPELTETIVSWTSQFLGDPIGVLQSLLPPLFSGTGQAIGFVGAVIGTTTYFAMTAILVPIYFFIFAWRFHRLSQVISPLVPVSQRETTWHIVRKIDEAVAGFFRGRLLIGIITAVLYAAGWALTDVPYWFLLGVATGILTIIPYVSVIGWPLAVALKYLDVLGSGNDVEWLSVVVLPSLPYLVVQFLESWWLTPWIQANTMNLSFVTVIIAVLMGGAVSGFLGLLLAIPIAASVKIVLDELVLPRWQAWAARR
ncbi:MAG TPA: AI-2E family transporter [Nitrospira sp.]|nr:AI-2E family transporter [Nitrospira sp.]